MQPTDPMKSDRTICTEEDVAALDSHESLEDYENSSHKEGPT
jgi:hypothetical protein